MLAGLSIVSEGEVPGRPPGAELELIVDRRAAASSENNQILLKELAMKTYIITAILVLGALLRPQSAPTTDQGLAPNGSVAVVSVGQTQTTPQALSTAEMNAVVGGNMSGCYEYKGPDGDTYGTCCLDLWFVSLCVTVNESAVARLVSSVF